MPNFRLHPAGVGLHSDDFALIRRLVPQHGRTNMTIVWGEPSACDGADIVFTKVSDGLARLNGGASDKADPSSVRVPAAVDALEHLLPNVTAFVEADMAGGESSTHFQR